MNKAKQMAESKYFQHRKNGKVIGEGYLFTVEDFAIFWSQLCKEQRKMCYESHWDMSCSYPEAQFEEDNIRDAIVDAPEPKLD